MKKSIFATVYLLLLSISLLAQKKPNVIYIYADDLGYGELGAYGQQKIKTPFLDAICSNPLLDL